MSKPPTRTELAGYIDETITRLRGLETIVAKVTERVEAIEAGAAFAQLLERCEKLRRQCDEALSESAFAKRNCITAARIINDAEQARDAALAHAVLNGQVYDFGPISEPSSTGRVRVTLVPRDTEAVAV